MNTIQKRLNDLNELDEIMSRMQKRLIDLNKYIDRKLISIVSRGTGNYYNRLSISSGVKGNPVKSVAKRIYTDFIDQSVYKLSLEPRLPLVAVSYVEDYILRSRLRDQC